jgi:arabinogalactan endo-1,4-beta-galactosidase
MLGGWSRRQSAMAAPQGIKFRNSLCVSPFAEGVFGQGITFRAGSHTAKNVRELQQLMMAYGSSELFTRLGSRITGRPQPGGGGIGMAATLQQAKLARSLGIPLNPELLLCSYYGDESGQPEPDFSDYPQIRLRKPWHELTIEEICNAMRLYGELAAGQILATGVTVNYWDIGNEVDLGIAGVAMPPLVPSIGGPGWQYRAPDAVDPEIGKMSVREFFGLSAAEQVAWGQQHLWGHVGSILAAVADGIRKVEPKARFATHVGGLATLRPEVFSGFYGAVEAKGFKSSMLGGSYYPTAYPYFLKPSDDRLALYKEMAQLAMKRIGKPIYISEFGYAAAPMSFGGQSWANPIEGYPVSPAGQAAFLRDLVGWGVHNGTLVGIRPWAPDFVGSGWQPMALFDAPDGGIATARAGLSSIEEGLQKKP